MTMILPVFNVPTVQRAAIAYATVAELPHSQRAGARAERFASALAERRATTVFGKGAKVSVSRTHRDGLAACIVAPADTRVGIDVERRSAIPASHARMFATARELRGAHALSLAELWSLKEAFWKALRLDDSVFFHELELDFDRAARVRAVRFRNESRRATAVMATPWRGYVLSVAHVGGAL